MQNHLLDTITNLSLSFTFIISRTLGFLSPQTKQKIKETEISHIIRVNLPFPEKTPSLSSFRPRFYFFHETRNLQRRTRGNNIVLKSMPLILKEE